MLLVIQEKWTFLIILRFKEINKQIYPKWNKVHSHWNVNVLSKIRIKPNFVMKTLHVRVYHFENIRISFSEWFSAALFWRNCKTTTYWYFCAFLVANT